MYAILTAFRLFKNILWSSDTEEDHDVDCQRLLQKLVEEEKSDIPLGSINADDYLRGFGKVTQCSHSGGFINKLFFNPDIQKPAVMKKGDIVEYLYKRDESGHIRIIKILSVIEDFNTDSLAESKIVNKRIIVTKVVQRQGRDVIAQDSGLKFNLDNVKIDFIPMIGDWLELCVLVHDENSNCENNSLFNISEVRALRSLEVKASTVTHWDSESGIGTIGNTIFFTIDACNAYTPSIGDEIVVDAIESDQGHLTWRALSIVLVKKNIIHKETKKEPILDHDSRRNIVISGDFSFGKMKVGEVKKSTISVTNNTNHQQVLSRIVFCSSMKNSQFKVQNAPNSYELSPHETVTFTVECSPSFVGYTEEGFKLCFKNFYIRKFLKVYVENSLCQIVDKKNISYSNQTQRSNFKKHMDTRSKDVVKGIKISRPPAFIHVRIPSNPIPQPLWNIMSKYYEADSLNNNLVEDALPILTNELNFVNYQEKFHTLLYLEEIAQVVSIRSFDMEKAYLLFEGEFLTLEVNNLAEGRPSLVIGDSVKVHDPHTTNGCVYDGCIHDIVNDKIYAKFSSLFHNSYKGEDVSVFFSSSRTPMVFSHYALDLSVKFLGKEILFPEKIVIKEPVIDIDQSIHGDMVLASGKKPTKWFNDQLNELQKSAVVNALKNVARPLPYVIFGPPGTGKTVTLVETVLQIWNQLPESRILVVTPSNSSANLIAERLIDSALLTPGCLVRLVAFHILRSNSISEKLKDFCAAVNISDQKESHKIEVEEEKRFYSRANIGRHRITVTTCVAVGRLYHFGFPKGHFTHIVMDEAGQASEPESMIPMCYLDKHNGQIILAGDPQQLGPLVLSHHSQQFGLEESYLGRLIKTFPYQRDTLSYSGMTDGYNPKVLTKLLYNYRAIPKLLTLPSELYYNGALISKVSTNLDWVDEMITKVSPDVVYTKDNQYPGIMFYGIRGINMKGEDLPSWYNPHEASMLSLFISKLYENGVSEEDIGVISPYIQQNKFIRTTLTDLELPIPKVGTVEEFQGQEKKIILASTVRSCEMTSFSARVKNMSTKQIMGFLRNPKRLNVLLTRAQVLLVIFGNPHTLCTHQDWKYVVNYAVNHGSYVGCDLPNVF